MDGTDASAWLEMSAQQNLSDPEVDGTEKEIVRMLFSCQHLTSKWISDMSMECDKGSEQRVMDSVTVNFYYTTL